jgi:protein-ribulosamine 3-kinase
VTAGPPAVFAAPLVSAVERLVSEYAGHRWRASAARDLADYASHPSAILSDGAVSVFVKFSAAPNALEQFEAETAGLSFITQRSGVRTPGVIGVLAVEGGAAMVLEALEAVERAPRHWRDIGRALARLHGVHGQRFGLERHGYFGPLYQDNRPLDDWPSFYAERRLRPLLRMAIDSGHLPLAVARQVEQLIGRLPELCGPGVAPALLHGDAQQNNFISTENGAVLIDPAVYYGHPEIDLALLDYFQPVPQDVFDGYQEIMPIEAGFAERRELWRVFPYLAVVTVVGGAFGADFLDRLSAAVQKYG